MILAMRLLEIRSILESTASRIFSFQRVWCRTGRKSRLFVDIPIDWLPTLEVVSPSPQWCWPLFDIFFDMTEPQWFKILPPSSPHLPLLLPPLVSITAKLLTSAAQTSGEVMRALMAPCLVIYGEARHYSGIYGRADRGCILPQFHLAIIYFDFYGNKVFFSSLAIQLMPMMERVLVLRLFLFPSAFMSAFSAYFHLFCAFSTVKVAFSFSAGVQWKKNCFWSSVFWSTWLKMRYSKRIFDSFFARSAF